MPSGIYKRKPSMFKRGENHHLWKGQEAGYSVIHRWVQHKLGIADICGECGSTKKVEWANISKKYLRNLTDWKKLCHSCHMKFDGIEQKVWKTRREKYGVSGHKPGTSWKGWKHTDESREKMSKKRLGKKFSEEHKRNLAESIKKYWDKRRLI